MIPIFCITLRQSPERTKLAQAHFAERGLDVTIFPGIHAPTMGLVTTKIADRRDNYIMQPGQVGCLLSHYMLWQTLMFLPHEEVMIVEDDAVFCDGFVERFKVAQRRLPADWQFCYVGHATKDTHPQNGMRVQPTNYEPGTHAYIVKRAALEILLATNQEMRTHCDIQIGQNSLPKLRSYRFMPALVDQRTQQKDNKGDYLWLSTTNDRAHTDATVQGPLAIVDKTPEELYWRIRSKLLPNLGGWCHEVKAVRMAEMILERKPNICVEIGVFQGKSLFTAAMALRFLGGSGKAFGIDPWTQADSLAGMAKGPNLEWWRNNIDHEHYYKTTAGYREQFGLADWCELIRCRSDDRKALDLFPDGSIEFFHLDGNHGPQSLTDAKLWLPKLKRDAVIFFDDVGWFDGGVETTKPALEYFKAAGWEETERTPPDCAVLMGMA